jgi:hypothetical protein
MRLLRRLSLLQAQTRVAAEHVEQGRLRGGREFDVSATESGKPREHELERRIEDLEARDPAAFGHFTLWDWTACTALCLVVPLLALWWFAP